MYKRNTFSFSREYLKLPWLCLLTNITVSLRHIPESPTALESLFSLKIVIPNMAEFAVNFGFLAQEYNTWFADEHRHEPRVTFDIVASSGTYLCGSESFF